MNTPATGPEQRQARNNGSKFTVLAVATQRSWRNAEDEWVSKVEWHRIAIIWNLNGRQVERVLVMPKWISLAGLRRLQHRSEAVRLAEPRRRAIEGEEQRNHSGDRTVMALPRPASSFVGESFAASYSLFAAAMTMLILSLTLSHSFEIVPIDPAIQVTDSSLRRRKDGWRQDAAHDECVRRSRPAALCQRHLRDVEEFTSSLYHPGW